MSQDEREMLLFAEDFRLLLTDTGGRKTLVKPAVVSSRHGGGLFIRKYECMIIYFTFV